MSADLTLFSPSSPVQMTSLEISGLVEKRHDNVKRTIETLAEKGVVVLPQIEDVPFVDDSGRNRTTSAYVFSGDQGKRDSFVVVAQLSPEFTGRLVDRWQELEAKQSLAVPSVKDPVLAAHIQALVELDAVKQRQFAMEAEQHKIARAVEENAQKLRQIETASDHFTIIGWCRYTKQNRNITLADAARMGKIATKFCKDHEIPTGSTPDPRFGTANTYPLWVLDELFDNEVHA